MRIENEQTLALHRERDGAAVAQSVSSACSFVRRLRGLIDCRRIPAGAALWLQPGGSIHTFGMCIDIDVVFLDRELTVLAVHGEVSPRRVRLAPWRTSSTLELGAGRSKAVGLQPGDMLMPVKKDGHQAWCKDAPPFLDGLGHRGMEKPANHTGGTHDQLM